MNVKQILDSVLRESGFTPPSAYATSSNDADKQAFDLANRALRMLSTERWRILYKSHTFTTTSSQEYDLPADYREIVPDTIWNATNNRPVLLPPSDEYWAYLEAHTGATGIEEIARITGGKLYIQNPTAGEQIRFEYISGHPAVANDDSTKERFTADDDTTLLDDDLIAMDIKWRWKKLKGLDWQEDYQEMLLYMKQAKAADKPPRTLNMVVRHFSPLNQPYVDTWQ